MTRKPIIKLKSQSNENLRNRQETSSKRKHVLWKMPLAIPNPENDAALESSDDLFSQYVSEATAKPVQNSPVEAARSSTPNYTEEFSTSPKSSPRYKCLKLIGSGSFGKIFEAIELSTSSRVAIKMETKMSKSAQLFQEYSILHRYFSDCEGFPSAFHFARTVHYNYFSMTLLGPTLGALHDLCGGRFGIATVAQLAIQLLTRLEDFHDRTGFLHRDIKPDNLLMGTDAHSSTLFLVDFGLARRFIDRKTGEHVAQSEVSLSRHLTGTARYASANAHGGNVQSRRDDMEASAYVLVYLLRGQLPWQGVRATNKVQRYEKICEAKMTTSTAALCDGLAPQIEQYVDYCKKLPFAGRPDYEMLRTRFRELRHPIGVFDWSM